MIIRRFLHSVLLVFGLLVNPAVCIGQGGDARDKGVRLVVTPAHLYKHGEHIEVMVKIENISSQAIYVNPNLSDPLDAGVILELLDAKEQAVSPSVAVHGGLPDYSGIDPVEYVKKRWIRLEPRHFYGRKMLVPVLSRPKSGRYKVTAVYFSAIRHRLSPSQQKKLDTMGSAVLVGRLASSPVSIEIVP